MSEAAPIADSAPVPDGAVINETPASYSEPLGSQTPVEPEPVAKPASLDDSIDRAIAKSEAKQAEADKAKAKPEAKIEPKHQDKEPQPRDNGKFAATKAPADAQAPQEAPKPQEAAKPSFTDNDPPSRFSEDAKKDWHAAPESVRRESERAIKELTDGFQKYRQSAERDQQLDQFHRMAEQSGTKLETVVDTYVKTEQLLRSDPIKGLESICENLGLSLKQVAEHYLGQPSDLQQSDKDVKISQLEQKLQRLEQGVNSWQEQQQTREVQQTIESFKSDPKYARFDELKPDIGMFLQTGRANNLSEAYQLADRLNPAANNQAPVSTPAASSAAPSPEPVHPDKGLKSVHGAPTPGFTSPSGKKRAALSLDEALDRAFGAAG